MEFIMVVLQMPPHREDMILPEHGIVPRTSACTLVFIAPNYGHRCSFGLKSSQRNVCEYHHPDGWGARFCRWLTGYNSVLEKPGIVFETIWKVHINLIENGSVLTSKFFVMPISDAIISQYAWTISNKRKLSTK